MIAKLAFEKFEKRFKNQYDLRQYKLSFESYLIKGEVVHSISFMPQPVGLPSDGILDIAQDGLWANGPGVSYFYAAGSLELVKTIYMR